MLCFLSNAELQKAFGIIFASQIEQSLKNSMVKCPIFNVICCLHLLSETGDSLWKKALAMGRTDITVGLKHLFMTVWKSHLRFDRFA